MAENEGEPGGDLRIIVWAAGRPAEGGGRAAGRYPGAASKLDLHCGRRKEERRRSINS
jgi:hypothetical protein